MFLNGELDAGVASCGQVVGLVHDLPSVKEIIETMVTEARAIGQRLSTLGVFSP